MTLAVRDISAPSAREWFETRSYRHAQFARPCAARRRASASWASSVSLVLPTREVAPTLGPVLDEVAALNERAPLVDQVVVVDAASADGTADLARGRGAEVYDESELMPAFGPVVGKGDAMWRALSVARGDLIVFADSDTANFGRHFIYGLLGPLLSEPAVRFVKGAYHRPFTAPDGTVVDDAGRVTELTAKPLFGIFYPELCGFGQPLAGEVAARRDLLRSIPFCTGYAVETAMMIDVLRRCRPRRDGAGRPRHAAEPLAAAAGAGRDVLRGRARGDDARRGRGRCREASADPETYLHAACTPGGVQLEHRACRCSSARRWRTST